MSNEQPLAAGDAGEQVEELQRRLGHLGYYQGEVDGHYGESTEEAVRQFQAAYGKTEDGAAGVETLETLDTEAQTAGYAASAEYAESTESADYGQETEQDYSEQAIQVGQLSEDGLWQWDGTQWVAAEGQAQEQTQSDAGAEQTIEVGQLSEDGYWQWDGTQWVAVQERGQDQTEPSAQDQAEVVPAESEVAAEESQEAKPWESQINDEIDDPETEEADLPTLDESASPMTESEEGVSA